MVLIQSLQHDNSYRIVNFVFTTTHLIQNLQYDSYLDLTICLLKHGLKKYKTDVCFNNDNV